LQQQHHQQSVNDVIQQQQELNATSINARREKVYRKLVKIAFI